MDDCILIMESEKRIPDAAVNVVRIVKDLKSQVSNAVLNAAKLMDNVFTMLDKMAAGYIKNSNNTGRFRP